MLESKNHGLRGGLPRKDRRPAGRAEAREPRGTAFVVELPPLKGRDHLAAVNVPVYSMVEFMVD